MISLKKGDMKMWWKDLIIIILTLIIIIAVFYLINLEIKWNKP